VERGGGYLSAMEQTRYLPLFAILAMGCSDGGPKDDVADVKACYESYFAAMREGDGERAAALVDSRTVDYYARMLELARSADSAQVAALDLMDKATVLGMRLRGNPGTLRAMDGRSALALAVDGGLMGGGGMNGLGLGTVEVEGDVAKAGLTMRGFPVPASFRFQREDGHWRIDLTSLFDLSRMALGHGAGGSDAADALLMEMLSEASGGEVPPGIWHPMR